MAEENRKNNSREGIFDQRAAVRLRILTDRAAKDPFTIRWDP
jgi:hypothetical protein